MSTQPLLLRSHQERTCQTTRGWIHQRSLSPRVSGESCTGSQEEQQWVEDVCWLHRPQQTLSEGSFWAPTHRPSHRLDGRLRSAILPWLLLRLSSNSPQGRRSNQDSIHHSIRCLWIQDHVLWIKERWSNILACHTAMLHQSASPQRGSLCR